MLSSAVFLVSTCIYIETLSLHTPRDFMQSQLPIVYTHKVQVDLLPSSDHLGDRVTEVEKDLYVTGKEIGDGEGREDGEGVSWERKGRGVEWEVLSLHTNTESGQWDSERANERKQTRNK